MSIRFHARTSRNTGVSVGPVVFIVFVILIAALAVWALVIGAVLGAGCLIYAAVERAIVKRRSCNAD